MSAPTATAPSEAPADQSADRAVDRATLHEAAAPSSWVLPVIAAVLAAGVLAYVELAELDSIEARLLATPELLARTWEHVQLIAVSTVVVVLIAVPLGVLLTRRRARLLAPPVLAVANAGQAVPSIGILVLLAILFGVGFSMAVVALVVYAMLPVLRNTMVGIQHVDRAVVDAGRGMGMSARQVLLGIELPLAVPVMLAGIRVALILNVGVATLATYTNAGGLGSLIESGIVFNRTPVLLAGSVLVVALALLVDWVAGLVEHVFRPRGL